MNDKQIAGLANSTLTPLLGTFGLDRVEVVPGGDHDDDPALFITAYYRPGSSVPQGEALLEAFGALHRALRAAGEERFSYLDHRFSDDDAFEEDALDGDKAAPIR